VSDYADAIAAKIAFQIYGPGSRTPDSELRMLAAAAREGYAIGYAAGGGK
jgi:hypothetical protein